MWNYGITVSATLFEWPLLLPDDAAESAICLLRNQRCRRLWSGLPASNKDDPTMLAFALPFPGPWWFRSCFGLQSHYRGHDSELRSRESPHDVREPFH